MKGVIEIECREIQDRVSQPTGERNEDYKIGKQANLERTGIRGVFFPRRGRSGGLRASEPVESANG